jgi:hypothetical protein
LEKKKREMLMVTIFAAVLMAQTWCWAADLHSTRTCVYSRQQCEEIVRLQRTGKNPASARSIELI